MRFIKTILMTLLLAGSLLPGLAADLAATKPLADAAAQAKAAHTRNLVCPPTQPALAPPGLSSLPVPWSSRGPSH